MTTENKRVFLYLANHGKRDGIEDYITIFIECFQKRGVDIICSDTLMPNQTNLIIDEFTNLIESSKISTIKQHYPATRLIYVLTEFVSRKWGVTSFNHFGGMIDSSFIALFNVYIRYFRKDFPKATLLHYLTAVIYAPICAIATLYYFTYDAVNRFRRRHIKKPNSIFLKNKYRLFYLCMRYLGLQANLHHADAIISSHKDIITTMQSMIDQQPHKIITLGVIYPELDQHTIIDSLLSDKTLCFEITGSVSHYRKKWLKRLQRDILISGLKNRFLLPKVISFSDQHNVKENERAAYSLHPPQSKSWPYCSPTRLYRALTVDHNLPLITHHFAQNPIEDVCFLYKGMESLVVLEAMHHNHNILIEFITPRIVTYNNIIKPINQSLIQKVMEI